MCKLDYILPDYALPAKYTNHVDARGLSLGLRPGPVLGFPKTTI